MADQRDPPVDEDETTIRLLLEGPERADGHQTKTLRPGHTPEPIPIPPPLPRRAKAGDQSTPLALEVPKTEAAARPATRKHFTKIGAAIFAAGVLVGVVGSLTLVTSRAPLAHEATPNVPAAAAAQPAPRAAATAAAIEGSSGLHESANIEAENGTGRRSEEAPPALTSSSGAPDCQQLLGDDFVERDDPKAAQRETRTANRKLVLGNVPEAQAAYCRAFLWDRSNVDRHVNLGRLFLVRRDWEKAAEYGQSALKLDPTSPRALGVVGDAWAALSRTDEARSAWLAAEKKTTASRRELDLIARRNMALAKRVERLQDFSLAERLYRRVLLLQPEHLGATRGLASCLARIGDHAAAETWAYRADMLKLRRKRGK